MKPRHFWWLLEIEGEKQGANKSLPKSDKDAILDALRGNPKGSFW